LVIALSNCFKQDTADTHIFTAPVGSDTPINTIGDVKANLGKFVRAVLQQPDLTQRGTVVSAVIAQTTLGGWVDDWSKATGKSVMYLKVSMEDYQRLWGGFGVVEGANLAYFEEYGSTSWASVDDTVLTKKELGLESEAFVGVKECLRTIYR
jgi:hypothetical protein